MKCKEAYVCLLGAQRADALPPELIQHLFRCAKCRQRQMRLLRLEQEIREMPLPGESPDARRQLLAKLEPRARVPLAPEPAVRPRFDLDTWRGRAAVLTAAAAILLAFGLGIGWTLSQMFSSSGGGPVVSPRGGPLPSAGPAESVVSGILEKHLRLAETSSASEQLTLLADMATELRGEAMRLAKEGPVDDLLLVSNLYERVVCQGVIGRAKMLPAEQQPGVIAPLMQHLEQTARETEQAASGALPGAAEGLRNLASAARAASQSLAGQAATLQPRSPSWDPARSGTNRDLLGILVIQGLLLAEENDPLRRADYCNDVAEHLVQGILLASSSGDTDRAEKLGGFLGSIIDRGVATNLDRYQPDGVADVRLAEVNRIGARSTRTVEVLEKTLEKAPAAAQPGLQKALEASSGPSKPDRPDGKGRKPPRGLPPGLQKALQKGKPIPANFQKQLPKDLFDN